MREDRSLAGVFKGCTNEGSFSPLAKIDTDQVRAMFDVALADFGTVKEWSKKAARESGQWNAIYKLAYDVLHTLSEAFLVFDKIKARTHECVFAYLCEKHPEFEFDWNFFEKVRTVRNRSIYYGEPASYAHWKEIDLQINLYIKTLEKAVETRQKV
ncbi:hypothetical protein HY489_04180 [Candidatus Woesearchaeota archaeon]|nr:hypothetical protein [Candidatus Woesearchaeota archaeon]